MSEKKTEVKTFTICAARVTSYKPLEYRLQQKKDGTLVLQGLFTWQQGSEYGGDWKDLPTEIEAHSEPVV